MRSHMPNARVLVGIALMLVATGLGAVTLQRAAHRTPVWRVGQDLAAGTVLTAADVHLAEVVLEGSAYVPATRRVVGLTLMRDLSAGELLPRQALRSTLPPAALVTVPVEPLHLPPDLRRGQRVDVWLSLPSEEQAAAISERILTRVLVEQAPGPDASGRSGVVLSVPRSAVGTLVSALRRGEIDLVAVRL